MNNKIIFLNEMILVTVQNNETLEGCSINHNGSDYYYWTDNFLVDSDQFKYVIFVNDKIPNKDFVAEIRRWQIDNNLMYQRR